MRIKAFATLFGTLTTLLLAGFAGSAIADTPPAPESAVVKGLLTRDLIGAPGKTLEMLTVEYVPGGATLAHRHNAQVFVYVLEGSVRMQVKGSPEVKIGRGGTFYEGPDDIHTVSANATKTKPAKILVFIVKDTKAPILQNVTD